MEASALQKSMERAMGMGICRIEYEDEETKRKRKGKKVDWFMLLTDDILLDILKRLPDAFLGYKAKYVCKRWWDLIRNRIALNCASFILQKTINLTARHVGMREEGGEGLQATVQDLDIPSIGMIESWGDEFLLISKYKQRKKHLYVYNRITKEGSYLPEFKNASCRGYCSSDKCGVAISFNGFKGRYKVVHLCTGPPIECHMLSLRKGINVSSKWKKIKVPNCMNGGQSLGGLPVSVQGRYIHWKTGDDKRVFSMDMAKGEIVDLDLPVPFSRTRECRFAIFEMGGNLAFVAEDEDTVDKAEIWILNKDFQWEKLQSVNLHKWYYKSIPVCGVVSRSNKYIILECRLNKGMSYYDLKNGVVKTLDIHIDVDEGCMFHSSPPSIFK